MIHLNLSGDFSFNENLYNYGLILSQTAGTTTNLFTLGIIYVYRGAEMRSYRWHLFLYQLFSTLLDFSMDTLAAPVFFFPHMAGTCTGWLRTLLGIPTFNVYVLMMTFGGICLHFICFSPLYYRWQIIINDGSYFKFKSKKAKVLFQVLQLAIGTPMLYVFMSLQYEEETGAIEAFKQHNPTDAYLANVDGFYVLNTWRNDMVLWSNIYTLFWLVALILLCVFMAIGCARGLDVNREHMSDRTKKMHIRFLKNIFFQSSIPMLLLEIPVLIWFVMMICDLRFPGQQNFTNLTVFSTCIHGAFGSFFVFYLNRSYRIFFQQKVGKFTKLKSVSLNKIFYPNILDKKLLNHDKWIVVTSIQYPTEDMKNLATQSGWKVVVVADRKTPSDWSHPGVHFLSVEDQYAFGIFAQLLPFGSYTRKNIGYLYAILNGAKWIYDTDDDNKPYGLGLDQFDYNATVSGLRYISKTSNISEKLFNPHQFYGFKKMWPRGFPLEHLRDHTNGKERLIVCRKMRAAAVQQGIVHNDPDVDAIYRLQNADKKSGLSVTFNPMSPAVTLEEGTYAPWNSQNTLFHYRAFFTMFLPTSVAFRVTDIWRSYFAQKLLHLIGEEVAFYPVNAVQYRNAHNYLNDFNQEIDVYSKAGAIIEFLDSWSCTKENIDNCTILKYDFFKQSDYDLVKAWIEALRDINYTFPPMKFARFHEEYRVNLTEKYSNCREANIDLGVDEYNPKEDKQISRAQSAIDAYEELIDWCEVSEAKTVQNLHLPNAQEFSELLNSDIFKHRQRSVLVIMNNFPWKNCSAEIGLLQRMYSPFFGMTIFCGTWDPNRFKNATLPIIEPINFVNISADEMDRGYQYNYCMAKVKDLRLQNVDGYFFMADDTTFNFWNEYPKDKIIVPAFEQINVIWWRPWAAENLTRLVQTKYKDDKEVQDLLNEAQHRLYATGRHINIMGMLTSYNGRICSDMVYLPSEYMDYFSRMVELLNEAGYFVENAMLQILRTIGDYEGGAKNRHGFVYDFNMVPSKGYVYELYKPSGMGYHPTKLSPLDKDLKLRGKFCDNVIYGFAKGIFEKKKEEDQVQTPQVLGVKYFYRSTTPVIKFSNYIV